MTHSGNVSAGDVISDVLRLVDDTRQRDLSPGEYVDLYRDALRELSLDTFFDEQIAIIHREGCLTLELPKGLMNIVHIWAFSGDKCTGQNRANVWHARGYIREGKMQFKEQAGVQCDPIMDNVMGAYDVNRALFYNTLGSNLMLSDACAAFEKVLIEYRGLAHDLMEAKILPEFLKDAVKWWMTVEALQRIILIRKDATTRDALTRAMDSLHGDGRLSRPGAWLSAKRRVQDTDQKQLEDMMKYTGAMGPKLW